MHTDRVPTPEVSPSAGAGGLVWTQETVAMFEVSVPVPLDLPGIRVPITTDSDHAENRRLPAEVDDRPTIAIFVIAVAAFINAAPAVAVLEESTPAVKLQKRHLTDILNRHPGGVRTRRSLESIEGDGVHVFLTTFKDTGRWRKGTRGRCLLMTSSATGWDRIWENKPAPALLMRPPTRRNPRTMGSGKPVLVVSIRET